MPFIITDPCIETKDTACVDVCPVDATPAHQKILIEANAIYRNGDPDTIAQAEALAKQHVAEHADIMAVPAAERQAAHARF